MTIASLLVWSKTHDVGRKVLVDMFSLSAPKSVQDFIDTKAKESGYKVGLCGHGVTINSSSSGRGVDLYLLLSWMEEGFGPIVNLAADQGNSEYIFRSNGALYHF
ncbi:expressed unknown protein [Seminavis robusta]|uniref:Uncharacterized protein n=1 Tax=Seminavis robusta TaxID=568900 RepID=A0A9N8DWP0_9STRA|nr:expressed unknown protein [Seminavis robusta]|eukprot:Sro303_g112381.1  (105) ;mRNA; f:26901-27215